jgi:pyruvate dehydrogenase E1 component
VPFVTSALTGAPGPVVAVTDYMRAVPDQIRQWVPQEFVSLGADGFGISDTRPATRRYFGIDGPSVVIRTLELLAARGEVAADVPKRAVDKYNLLDVRAGTTGNAGGES